MNLRHISRLGLITFLIFSLTPILTVHANVPTVVELKLETRGQDIILVIQVRHSSPSQNHYVDSIEVEVDGNMEKIEGLDPQSETTFTVEHTMDPKAADIRARAHCTTHGWSQWASEEEEPSGGGGGIPGFPSESITLGLVVGAILVWATRRQ